MKRSMIQKPVSVLLSLLLVLSVFAGLSLPALAADCEHNMVETERKAPTCIESGWSRQTCTACGYTTVIELEATGHRFGTEGDYRFTCIDCPYVDRARREKAQAADDAAAAAHVTELINAIGTVDDTKACGKRIDAADVAYNKLTDAQKALVPNAETLRQAESQYMALREGACKYCGEKHDSSIGGGITAILHTLLYHLLHFFGKM